MAPKKLDTVSSITRKWINVCVFTWLAMPCSTTKLPAFKTGNRTTSNFIFDCDKFTQPNAAFLLDCVLSTFDYTVLRMYSQAVILDDC